ncbi:MAG: ATP-binding protein [Candidatus Algichlamydia australiensis]|nr:ATP-binding protein [Chlamydiales bacterium]
MIEEFLKKIEGKCLEFKENTSSMKQVLKTIVAFANTSGGIIIFGIKDKTKEVVGLKNPLLDEEKITNTVFDSIAPLIIPNISICTFRKREVLLVKVPHLPGPYYLKSEGIEHGSYVRFGSTNRKSDAETLRNLKLLAESKYFDELPLTSGELDQELIKKTFSDCGKKINQHHFEDLGIYTTHFGEKVSSIGGGLIFGKRPLPLFPDSMIRCACFQGKTKEKILDTLDIKIPLILSIDEITRFIKRNSYKKILITANRGVEVLEYPEEVIRELVINAIVHSDYSTKGSHIQIAIFSDRLEITSPGGLPFGQTMEKALSGYSRLRNRVIGRVFRELSLIEQWGSGLQRVCEVCRKMGYKTPLFEEKSNHFRATIFSEKEAKIELSSEESIIVDYLLKNRKVKTKEAAKLWKVVERTASSKLTSMVNRGILVRVATSKKDPLAYYALNEQFGFE